MSETILQVKNLKKYYMVGRKGLFGERSMSNPWTVSALNCTAVRLWPL